MSQSDIELRNYMDAINQKYVSHNRMNGRGKSSIAIDEEIIDLSNMEPLEGSGKKMKGLGRDKLSISEEERKQRIKQQKAESAKRLRQLKKGNIISSETVEMNTQPRQKKERKQKDEIVEVEEEEPNEEVSPSIQHTIQAKSPTEYIKKLNKIIKSKTSSKDKKDKAKDILKKLEDSMNPSSMSHPSKQIEKVLKVINHFVEPFLIGVEKFGNKDDKQIVSQQAYKNKAGKLVKVKQIILIKRGRGRPRKEVNVVDTPAPVEPVLIGSGRKKGGNTIGNWEKYFEGKVSPEKKAIMDVKLKKMYNFTGEKTPIPSIPPTNPPVVGSGKKEPNKWIQHIKQYAAKHNMSYRDALRDPKCKSSYK